MDRKSVLILGLCALLFAVWVVLTPKLYPPPKPPVASGTGTVATATAPTNIPATTTNVAAPVAPATNQLVSVVPVPGAPEESLVLTNGGARYTFTSQGGGLKLVEFDGQQYPEIVPRFGQKLLTNRPAAINRQSPHPMFALLNAQAVQGDGAYKLSRFTRTVTNAAGGAPFVIEGVRAEKVLANQTALVKEFEFGTNYMLAVRFRYENRSAQPLALPALEWCIGSAAPENIQDNGDFVGLAWSDGEDTKRFEKAWFDNRTWGCFPGTPISEYRAAAGGAAVHARWVAIYSQFFFAAARPDVPGNEIVGTRYALPTPSAEERAANRLALTNQHAYLVSLGQPATNVAAGESLAREFTVFAGPKEMRLVERIAPGFGGELDSEMLYPHTWSIFEVFSRLLLLTMNGLNSLGMGYALAIITITVILKLLFWPLTQASTRSMKRMAELQPQMKAIQEKYKGEPEKMQKKMMEFYRENKVNPVSGCLPMLVQIPVFIGFFTMVRSAIELRGATFLWATDLSRPDTVAVIPWLNFLDFIPFTWLHNFPINPLSLIMGVTMLLQARMTPMAPGVDPMAQKMMKYMPLFILLILYNYSAGLTLYWTVQNLLTMAQTKLTKSKVDPTKPTPSAPAAPAASAVALAAKRKKHRSPA